MHTILRLIVYVLCTGVGIAILIALGMLILGRDENLIPMIEAYLRGLQSGNGFVTPMLLGILQVLIPLALTFRWLSKRRFSREISYVTANGRVSVNLQAMEEALARAVMNEAQVKHAVVRIYEDRVRRMVMIQAVLTLWAEENITAANQRCQDILARRFEELMPEQRSVQVHLSVNRLRHRQSTEFYEAVRERKTTDTENITPGLAATAGLEGNEAGRDLLQKTKKRQRTDDGAIRERSETEYGEKPLPRTEERVKTDRVSKPSSTAATAVDEDPFADMYQGPVYAVPDEEEDNMSGESLPLNS